MAFEAQKVSYWMKLSELLHMSAAFLLMSPQQQSYSRLRNSDISRKENLPSPLWSLIAML